jgi:ubiquinone/menaquinone biosynthesis C-methylase UbiE
MSELSFQELADAATAYEELLVPALFQPWAERIANAARLRPGDRLLDVACGTGVLARTAAIRVGPKGSVVGLDINPGMLSVACRIAPDIEWQQGSAESLPYESETFDVVVSQFGLMFFADQRAALQEMIRVLAPGGRLAVAVFDSLDHNPAYAIMVRVLESQIGQQAADALRFPFVLGDTQELQTLFARTGVSSVVVTSQEEAAHFSDVRSMVLADVKGWFPLAGIAVGAKQRESLIAEAEDALKSFVTGGKVAFRTSAHIVTAVKA